MISVVIIAIAVIAACDSETPEQDDSESGDTILHVMSYNMRFEMETGTNDVHTWERRLPGIVDSFERYEADIVGTQELRLWQVDELDDALEDYWDSFGEARFLATDEHVTIYYRSDRFELLEHDTLWLSETPDVRGSKSWDTAHPRIVTYGLFKSLDSDFTFYVFNTHLDHRSAEARTEGLRLIVNLMLDAGDTPVIFTGDLNAFPESDDMEAINEQRDHFMHTFEPFAEKFEVEGRTSHGFNGFTEGKPIDYIFVSVDHFEVLETEIIRDRWEDRWWLSDHYPVFSRIKLKE